MKKLFVYGAMVCMVAVFTACKPQHQEKPIQDVRLSFNGFKLQDDIANYEPDSNFVLKKTDSVLDITIKEYESYTYLPTDNDFEVKIEYILRTLNDTIYQIEYSLEGINIYEVNPIRRNEDYSPNGLRWLEHLLIEKYGEPEHEHRPYWMDTIYELTAIRFSDCDAFWNFQNATIYGKLLRYPSKKETVIGKYGFEERTTGGRASAYWVLYSDKELAKRIVATRNKANDILRREKYSSSAANDTTKTKPKGNSKKKQEHDVLDMI